MMIYAYVITVYMYCCHMKKFEDLNTFLASNDRPPLLKKVEKKYLMTQKVLGLHHGKSEESVAEVVRRLLIWKHEFKVDYIDV